MAVDGTTLDEGFEVLPPDSEPPDPDEALSLEEALADPTVLDPEQDPPVALGRAPAIDFVQRRFIPNTAGGPLMVYGIDTLAQWVEKCLRTRRGENPACHPDFGLDVMLTDLLDGGPFDAGAVAEFEAIVERALSLHPAIDSIDEWQPIYTDLDDDSAQIRFTVIPTVEGEDPLELDVTLPMGP